MAQPNIPKESEVISMWIGGKNRRVWLIPLILPLFLLEPIIDLLRQLNHTVWEVVRNFVGFFEHNPLITILAIILTYLIVTRRG